ncbi:MAG: AIR synthase-related protein [Bacteroidia bacterium]
MTTLNDMGAAISHLPGVHAMTDITGFGFLGHLMEVCKGSNVSLLFSLMNCLCCPVAKNIFQSFYILI